MTKSILFCVSYGPARVAGLLWKPAVAAAGSPLLGVAFAFPLVSASAIGLVISITSPVYGSRSILCSFIS